MSFNNTAREDFWQSTSRNTISERCEAIFNQELFSDVKFVVRDSQGGSHNKTIPAHKFVLAISSPVFYAMFYGELAETKVSVEISDCEYESMLELFRFIYSNEANLTPDNVMQLMYLAKKYMLPSLADKCVAYLQENLNGSNVFTVLPDAQKYEEKELINLCWKVIEKETGEAVKSDGFMTIERSILEEIIEKDSLNIKEVELFKAVDRWAEKECEKQGLVVEGSVKRRILGERIVKGVRFPVMEEKEFADVVLDSEVLNHQEVLNMVKYFNSVLKVPLEFPKTKRSGPPFSCAAPVALVSFAWDTRGREALREEFRGDEERCETSFEGTTSVARRVSRGREALREELRGDEERCEKSFEGTRSVARRVSRGREALREEFRGDEERCVTPDRAAAKETGFARAYDPYFDDDVVGQETKDDLYCYGQAVEEDQKCDPYFEGHVVGKKTKQEKKSRRRKRRGTNMIRIDDDVDAI